ncbi:MAG: undecaprenyl-diphosphate phosphatase [Bacteroidetes bacterium]|nr:undecaprenyl-diphosphate phosphatase [Bacteroidota bacterium]MBU1719329.1 undecaprenyl-diphosphate phosphatase [Bacteroidota bacterium]
MDWLQALILGLLQGLTEFLPVSSSGHLELGKVILGTEVKEDLTFTVVVHGATVLSTLVVFRKDIGQLLSGLFKFKWNNETQYSSKIIFSMIPVVIVGLVCKDDIEALFNGDVHFIGGMLLITAAILAFTYLRKSGNREIGFIDAFIIGIAQVIATIPGISRSGTTIATALLIGNKREEAAKFSFLMVILPILAANAKDILDNTASFGSSIDVLPLVIGFITAFVAGLLACKAMIAIVKKGGLIWFSIYCLAVGLVAFFV